MVEMIAQFLTDLTGSPVSSGAVIAVLIVLVGFFAVSLFVQAWCRSGQIDWDAVDAEYKRLEDDEIEM